MQLQRRGLILIDKQQREVEYAEIKDMYKTPEIDLNAYAFAAPTMDC